MRKKQFVGWCSLCARWLLYILPRALTDYCVSFDHSEVPLQLVTSTAPICSQLSDFFGCCYCHFSEQMVYKLHET